MAAVKNMKSFVTAAMLAFLSVAPGAAAAPVTWSFFETGILSCNGGLPTSCVLPPQPFVLMTLALPGPTSSGTATWLGTGSQPVYTGDSFTLTVPFTRPLTPSFAGNPGGDNCNDFLSPILICDFNISWSETAGDLTSVAINLDAVNDDIGGFAGLGAFRLTGGPLASDGTLGGCTNTQCIVSGFWQSDLPVPEPTSAALLVCAIFGFGLVRRYRRERVAPAR